MEEAGYIYGSYKETTRGMDILRGACDLHVHTGPAVFARLLTHLEAAEQACSVGMKAVVIKDHHSETASKAKMVREFVPEVETFGGVVLNYAVGGLNPFAVDAAINYGAKIIFMPTTDSSNHMNHFGMEGATYAHYHRVVSGRELSYRGREGITILTERGELLPEMEEILGKASRLKDEMLDLLQKDTEAFDDAAKAFKLPKGTEEQKKKRTEAIEKGLVKASEVPLAIMEKSLEVARLAQRVLKKGNEMAVTDGAISALFAEAAAIGGMINVRINFSWMKNRDYIEKTEKRLDVILEEIKNIKEEAISYTLEKLS